LNIAIKKSVFGLNTKRPSEIKVSDGLLFSNQEG